jgi:hypothetical protein
MAIKVNGTTVIDDGRNLVNIVSGAGASTTLGDVGTYALLQIGQNVTAGTTFSGSVLTYAGVTTYTFSDEYPAFSYSTTSPSGTWRCMGETTVNGRGKAITLFVRIS